MVACLFGVAAAADTAPSWQAPLGRDHPLTGRIWDTAAGRFIDQATLFDRVVDVRFVVTGESHNNPDHHRLQLRLLRAMFGNGRRVAVGMEVFDSHEQPLLDRIAALADPDDDQLVDVLGWNGRRQRALWEQYRPLVHFAIASGLPLRAMDMSRREAAAVIRDGIAALPPYLVERFALDRPLDTGRTATLQRDLVRAHCGMLFSNNLEGLTLAQRARDATMAQRLVEADIGGGVLLLAGYGHARGDRGVPYLLDDVRARSELVSVLFASVRDELIHPADYGQWFERERPPFDYVWFTPRADDEDPCDRLRRLYGNGAARTATPATAAGHAADARAKPDHD